MRRPVRVRRAATAVALGAVVALSAQGVAAGGPLTETVRAAAVAGPGEKARHQGGADVSDGPVPSRVQRLALAGTGDGRAALSRRATGEFGLLGVSWNEDRAELDGLIQARTRSAETGAWSDWIELEPYKPGLDGDRPGARGATEPVWVGPSDGAEVRVNDPSGELPAGLRLDLVDPGKATAEAATARATAEGATARTAATATAGAAGTPVAAEAPVAAADAVDPGPPSTVPQPPVVTRAEWGADESLNDEGPVYLPDATVKAVFVHHTTNGVYDCAQSAEIVRSLHVYHVKTNGWRDLGYNFLVDKCGTIFEGRQGGIDQPVMGAHTYGFNSESSSVAIIGDHTSVEASNAALTASARMAAYKLGQYGGDPAGTVSLVAGVTQKSYTGRQFTAGQPYTFDRISGHRDGYNTECPGAKLYPQLPALRTLAAGPVQNLAITSVGGAAVPAEGGYESPGPVTLSWSTSTPTSLISRFEVLVDGVPAATAAAGARSATAVVPSGTHQVALRAVHQSGRTADTAAVTVTVPHPKTFVPVTPQRLMDTRSGLGVPKAKIGPKGTVTLQVTGKGGVPATGVGAVVLNVTATRVTGGSSYVSVYPNGTTRTAASNLNVAEGVSVANLVVVPVVNGKVDFYNNANSIDLLADITGYYTTGDHGSRHVNTGPERVMDSRSGLGVPKAKIGAAGVATLQVAGVNGVPAEGVTAVVLNVTATGATGSSYVSVYPNGTTRTSASTLNVIAGRSVPNLVIVPVVNGKVDFYNNAGSVDLLADITGYYSVAGDGARHYNAGPKRLMDSRLGLGVPKAQVGPRGVVTLQVAGVEGVPADASAVVLNVTATRATDATYISVYPDGTTRTAASNLNVAAGVTVPNLVIVPVVNGRVSFYNNAGSVDLLADITGYFAP